jgi:hypothetical protein
MNRDSQRSAVYSWENLNVAPHDRTVVPFAQIEAIVRYVWEREGLEYPPQVLPLPRQKHKGGDATRTTVRFGKSTYTWIILHELAHSMTSTVDSRSNVHGALFMGIYCKLLTRYLNIDLDMLMKTAEAANLQVQLEAIPVFLER